MAPPSNCARIARFFREWNSKPIWLHSVVIRLLLLLGTISFRQKSYARSDSLFLFFSEISTLGVRLFVIRLIRRLTECVGNIGQAYWSSGAAGQARCAL